MARTTKRSLRGITMIETLAATAIITVALLGTVSIFFSMTTLTNLTAQNSVAYSLARRGVEEARNRGFANLADGTTVRYYDLNGTGGGTSQATSSQYSVTTVVSSDQVTNGVPAITALRTVVVTVRRISTGTVLETSGTYMAWGGV